jgi:nicotinamide mononucleotide (NMN) deamidase PncC
VALTDELAWSARKQTESDLGLALHAIPDPASNIQNLAQGQTYFSVTDGRNFLRRTSTMAGRGAYDRTRMTLNAIDLLRTSLIEGMV